MNNIERDNIAKHSIEGYTPKDNRTIDKNNTVIVSNKEHGGRIIDKIRRFFKPNKEE